jgi:hypothetical protein
VRKKSMKKLNFVNLAKLNSVSVENGIHILGGTV